MTTIPKPSSIENDASPALAATASLTDSSAASHWNFINGWKVVPQSNDRPPVLGVVASSSPSAAVRRSTVRRKHQEMFKAWSKARHD